MPEMPNRQNRQNHGTDRHRRWMPLRAAAVLILAAALIVNVVVIDAPQAGFLIPVFIGVAIAVYSENRENACGRRHAK